ncbi:ABC transporter permease [Cellvibrio sp. PSBB006]|uniref:ABC transporter permease n=1 Tax=Cellvibrio sp. PSBB006 TaxID=1987723 RepID=UPI000B3B14E4|nr:ABC transporter permease [Cellvibrio sp. PSBB006]ARU28406.1 ABC transporter ATP-binding protein [Cellvibrio sp. PSBB006]
MIIDTEKWQEIFKTLGQHKLRTSLTAFGVFWGIFMLTVLLGAGKGLENGVIEGFPRVTNSVYIWIQGTTQVPYQGLPIGRQIRLEAADVKAIQDNVPSVSFIRGQNSVGIWDGTPPYTKYKDKNGTFYVQGTHAGMTNINSMRIIEGRSINETDDNERRKVAIIGTRVETQLFDEGVNPLGENITISGISFTVIGVFKSLADGNQQQEEEKIYIPNDTLRYAFNQVGWVGSFVVIPQPGLHARIAEQDVKKYLAEIKKVSPDDVGVFGSFNLQNEFDKIQGLFTGIEVFSWMVAIGTIMAGAIGVGNIMLIVVKERTREIGLRKALGATPTSIVAMIVQESIFITAIAGYMGLVVGVFLLEGVSNVLEASGGGSGMFRRPEVDFGTAISALVVLVISGFLASLMPAAKAAAVNPIVALQDE